MHLPDVQEAYETAPSDGHGPYVAVDLKAVATNVGSSFEMLFGRLYYHLDRKYGYAQNDGVVVAFFAMRVGDLRHAIHFPYMAAVLAGLEEERRNRLWPLGLSIFAVAISFASLAVNLYKH